VKRSAVKKARQRTCNVLQAGCEPENVTRSDLNRRSTDIRSRVNRRATSRKTFCCQQASQKTLASEVWKPFIENCIKCYKPGKNIATDKQLFSIKTRCCFVQYTANKPDKSGIKFWLAADVKSTYLLTGFLWLGNDEHRHAHKLQCKYAVIRLTEPYMNEGRNATTDNCFIFVKLAKELKQAGAMRECTLLPRSR